MGVLGKKVPPPTKRRIPSRLPYFKVPGYIPTEGLMGCWLPFVGEGNLLKDYSGNGNDGAINGPTWTYDPRWGWILDYDGTNDYVDCGTDVSPTDAITVLAWAYLDAETGDYDYIAAKEESNWPWIMRNDSAGDNNFFYKGLRWNES